MAKRGEIKSCVVGIARKTDGSLFRFFPSRPPLEKKNRPEKKWETVVGVFFNFVRSIFETRLASLVGHYSLIARFRNRSGTKEPLILQLTLFFLREKEGRREKNLFYCIIIGEGPKWGELLNRGRTKRDWTGLLGGKKNRTRNPHKSFIFGNFPFLANKARKIGEFHATGQNSSVARNNSRGP